MELRRGAFTRSFSIPSLKFRQFPDPFGFEHKFGCFCLSLGVSSGRCSATIVQPICSGIYTRSARTNTTQHFFAEVNDPFTNYFQHRSQDQAVYEVSKHATLVNILTSLQSIPRLKREVTYCINNLTFLLCTLHQPRCAKDYGITKRQCETTLHKSCNASISFIRARGYVVQWPPAPVNCSEFPEVTDSHNRKYNLNVCEEVFVVKSCFCVDF